MIDTWTCHICHSERLDEYISVFKKDVSDQYNLRPGVMFENIRYCNDRPDCINRAKTFTFLKKSEKANVDS